MKASAVNTMAVLDKSQKQHQDLRDGFQDMSQGFHHVNSKLDALHRLLSPPISPVPIYSPVKEVQVTLPEAPSPSVVDPAAADSLSQPDLPAGIGKEAQSMPLHAAARKGDARAIRQILRRGAVDINATDDDGRTALHVSIMVGTEDFAKELLRERDVDVGASDFEGKTPLHYAAASDSFVLVWLLLSHRARPRKDDKDTDGHLAADSAQEGSLVRWSLEHDPRESVLGEGVLHFASKGDSAAVRQLLAVGARCDVEDEEGMTALAWACERGDVPLVMILCDCDGATIDTPNGKGRTPLILAIQNHRVLTVELLLKHDPDLEIKSKYGGLTALFQALLKIETMPDEGARMARALLDAGADIEATNNLGFRPLMCFAMYGSHDVVELLLRSGARVNARGDEPEGWTALIAAAVYDQDEDNACTKIALLLFHGADSEMMLRGHCCTALLKAVELGRNAQAQALIQGRANVNTMSPDGRTPLSLAVNASTPSVKLIEELVEHGACVGTRDAEDRTPLHYACMSKSAAAVDVLRQLLKRRVLFDVQDKDGSSPLHYAVVGGRLDIVDLLVKRGFDMELRNAHGFTALSLAVAQQDLDITNHLIQNGARVDTATKGNWTPLHAAARQGEHSMLNTLLEAGADPNPQTAQWEGVSGWTPLMMAARAGSRSSCESLVNGGAKVGAKNQRGETASMLGSKFPKVRQYFENLLEREESFENPPERDREVPRLSGVGSLRSCEDNKDDERAATVKTNSLAKAIFEKMADDKEAQFIRWAMRKT